MPKVGLSSFFDKKQGVVKLKKCCYLSFLDHVFLEYCECYFDFSCFNCCLSNHRELNLRTEIIETNFERKDVENF